MCSLTAAIFRHKLLVLIDFRGPDKIHVLVGVRSSFPTTYIYIVWTMFHTNCGYELLLRYCTYSPFLSPWLQNGYCCIQWHCWNHQRSPRGKRTFPGESPKPCNGTFQVCTSYFTGKELRSSVLCVAV